MGFLLGFAPFILFVLLAIVSVDLALWTALAAAFAIGIRDFARTRILRLLDVTGIVLFAVLALYTGFIEPGLSMPTVRLAVDGGFLLVAVVSVARRNPFTLDYAREQVSRELWLTPRFIRTNFVIAAVWTLALAAMTGADAATTFNARFPAALDVAVSLAALAIAIVITARFPVRRRAGKAKQASAIGR